jgi:DNA-binding NarL/FixJ family response regulator
VLVGLTGMLRDVLKEILAEPDIRIAGELEASEAVAHGVAAIAPDVAVVTGDDVRFPGAWRDLLAGRPRMRVLAITDGGRTSRLYELRPHLTELGEVSPQTLLEAVRTARRPAF